MMRKELSHYMNGESVTIIAEFIEYGQMKFDGEANRTDVNPTNGLITPMEFYDNNCLIEPMMNIDNTTAIKPLCINNNKLPVNNESHMWISECLEVQGCELKPETKYEIQGHIYAYTRKNETQDYAIKPYSVIELSDIN